ncbi:MAG TPA: MFS transporter [Solirubrobacteraceae bacterium]|nr:MFS transporter [Solirubrobacteraceae bacterium]
MVTIQTGAAASLRAGTLSSWVSRWRQPLVLTAVCMGQFMLQLDTTIVNVALPSIARSLHASTSGLQWVIDGYILALASLLLSSGRIGDRSGHKRVFLVGLGVFALGSGLCALAGTTWELVCFRVLQGIGAAIMLPATLALITATFPDGRERARAVGIWAGAGGLSLVLGPVLGGLLLRAFTWPAVFLVNLPVALAAAVLVVAAVPETNERSAGRMDLQGQALGAASLALLAAAAIQGGRHGFSTSLPVALLASGMLALVGFVLVERLRPEPMLPLGYFRNRAYAAANVAGLIMGFVMFSLLFIFALYFQQVAGDTPLQGGLRFIPLCGAFAITGPLIGRNIHRTGHWPPMAGGLALIALGTLLLLRLGVHSGYDEVWPAFLIIGIGYGITSTPMAAAVLGAVPPDRAGMASSTVNTARQIGGVFGIAILGSMLPAASGTSDYAEQFISGMHDGLLAAAILALVGAALTATQISRHS